nr:RNA-directed DNA polymerase, eukaryota, reverse transcriptase zinc-binding domain protein [Tanacetum cinerariifolium]
MVSNVIMLGPGVLDIIAAERNGTAIVIIHRNLIEDKAVVYNVTSHIYSGWNYVAGLSMAGGRGESEDSALQVENENLLSIGGRLTLLKSVLGSIPIFHMSIFRVSSKVLQILESIRGATLGGIEQTQFSKLVELVQLISLMPINDRWVWNLESSGEFPVASIRRIIDEMHYEYR